MSGNTDNLGALGDKLYADMARILTGPSFFPLSPEPSAPQAPEEGAVSTAVSEATA